MSISNININSISNDNKDSNLKNVIDLSLNQNKYLIETDKGCLFTPTTTFKIMYSPQLSHVLTCREYTKSIEQLNSTIEPLLLSFRLNNALLLFVFLLFPAIIVTSIFASRGKIFLPSIIVAGVSLFIISFSLLRKSFLQKKLTQGITRDIKDFNKRYSKRQVSLEYLITTSFNYKNGVEYSISLHLIYPIITITPGMFSLNNNNNNTNNNNYQQQKQQQQQKLNFEEDYDEYEFINSNENSSLLR